MTNNEIAMQLLKKMEASNDEWRTAAVFRENPMLQSALASHLAYSVGSAPLNYVSAAISDRRDTDAVVRVIAFTEEHIIVISNDGSTTSMIVPRGALQAVVLHEVPQLLNNDYAGGYRFRVELDYGSAMAAGPKIMLGHAYQSDPNKSELADFLPHLFEDLHR